MDKSDQLYKLILDNITDTIYILDLDLNYKYVSSSVFNLLGYTPQEVLSKNIEFFLEKEDVDIVYNLLKKRLMAEKTADKSVRRHLIIENRQKRKDGTMIWVEKKLSFLRDKDNKAIGILAIARDITENKNTQEALKVSEEKFRLSFKTSPDSIVLTRLSDGLIIEANDGFKNLSGYTDEEIIGKTTHEIALWKNVNDRDKMTKLLREKGEVKNLEFQFVRKDGTIAETLLSAAIISVGNEPHLITIVRDISENKKLLDIVQRSQKLESLGILAGGIAHDFNNLLTGIYGYIDMAIGQSRDEKVSQLLNSAIKSMDRARALSHQLLTFSKGGEPVKKPGKLFPFIEEIVKFSLSGSNIQPVFNVPDDIQICEFDKNQLSQVIENIIINAQQAMPLGGEIVISAQNITLNENRILQKTYNKDFVKISIKDSGIGIPADIISSIFDPFFTTKEKGHGLGLATSYSIVKKHGGVITVDSEMGKGTTFHIYLPATRNNVYNVQEEQKSDYYKGEGRILIMDDEDILRDVLKSILNSLGYEVIVTENGEQAIKAFKEEKNSNKPIIAMIFDLTVHGAMGGKDAIAEIRKIDENIPAFVASGYASDPIIANPQKYGFTDSIGKPFSIKELKELLKKHFLIADNK